MADKQLAKKGKSGVDNTFRRTWDKESYSERAAKREKEVLTCHTSSMCTSCFYSYVVLHVLQEKDTEESALDAKKRRRLGESTRHTRRSFVAGKDCYEPTTLMAMVTLGPVSNLQKEIHCTRG